MRKILVLVAIAMLGASCGRLSDQPPAAGGTGSSGSSGGSGGIEHPSGAGDLVLRVQTAGGFIAPSATLTAVPSFSMFGDGTVVTEGAHTEIYPGPALPPLIATHVSEEGIQAILQAAGTAGLLGKDATYGSSCVMDAGTTTFTLNAEGATHTVSATALGIDPGSCDAQDADARAALGRFWGKLGDLRSWLPEGSVGEDAAYRFTEVRVYVQPYQGDPGLTEPPLDWPLADLGSFGDPVPSVPDTRCGVVGGQDLEALRSELDRANQLTPWRSGGAEYSLLVRPLLPDEHSC